MKKARCKKPKRMVWHIFHFQQRFELPDDVRFCRRSPLQYTRDFVGSGQDDESITYRQQMNALRSLPNWLATRGAFHELKEIAANHSRCYRGYILDENYEPASTERISLWLGIDVDVTRQLLDALQTVRLLELVEVPVFDPSVNDDIPSGHEPSRSSTGKTDKYKGKGKDKHKSKDKRKSNNQNGTGKKGREKTTARTTPDKRKPKDKGMAGGQGQAKAETAAAPPTTPPMPNVPTASDAGDGTRRTIPSRGHPRSVNSRGREPEPLGSIMGRMQFRYIVEASDYTQRIYTALRTPHPLDSPEATRELANISAAWSEANGVLDAAVMADLVHHTIRDAERIGAKRHKTKWHKSPEAVWRWLFNKRFAALKLAA